MLFQTIDGAGAPAHSVFERVIAPFAAAILLALLVKNIILREDFLTVVTGIILVMVVWNYCAAHLGIARRVPVGIVLISSGVGICLSIIVAGPPGALWTFPTIIFGYFVVSLTFARVFACAMVLSVPALASQSWDLDLTSRLWGSLIATTVAFDILICRIIELNQKLVDLSMKDPLTGCFNRRYIPSLERRRSTRSEEMHLLSIDVDNFKSVNDTFGHDAGDSVLKDIAETAAREVRESDCIIRLGGDEFAIILNAAGSDESKAIAARITQRIAASENPYMATVTLSIGIARIDAGDTIASAISRADKNLYEAKKSGRNQVVA